MPGGGVEAGSTGVAVAVKVTLKPCSDGFADETKAVAELACVMLAVVVGWISV